MKFYKYDETLKNRIFKFNYDEQGNLILDKEINTLLKKEWLSRFFKENEEFRKKLEKEINENENTKEDNI